MYISEKEDGALTVRYDNLFENVKYKLEPGSEVRQNNGKIVLLKNNALYTSSKQYIFKDTFCGGENYVIAYRIFCVQDPVSKKLGLLDKEGNIVLPTEYDSIKYKTDYRDTSTIVEIVEKDGLYGLFQEKKGLVLPTKYDMIEPLKFAPFVSFQSYDHYKPLRMYIIKEKNQYGLFHLDKGWVLPAMYDSIESTIVSKDGKCGIFDNEGKIIIPLIYDAVISEYKHVLESKQNIAKLRILNTVYTIGENNNILEECEHYNFRKQDKYEKSPYRLIKDIELQVIT